MPQFELDGVGPARTSGLRRARDAEDAVRRAVGVGVAAVVEAEEDVQGWRTVQIGGEPAGRVRVHQRMRFRRD